MEKLIPELRIIAIPNDEIKDYLEEIKSLQNYFKNWEIICMEEKSTQTPLNFINSNISDNCIILYYQEGRNLAFLQNILKLLHTHRTEYNTLPYVLIIEKENDNNLDVSNSVLELDKTQIKCDERDIASIAFGQSKEKALEEICTLILKRFSYYHQHGDSFNLPNLHLEKDLILNKILFSNDLVNYQFKDCPSHEETINIMVVGRPGSGKSFFINKLLGQKRCREGKGPEITKDIISYSHRLYPIKFFDSPRFEYEAFNSFFQKVYSKKGINGQPIHAVIFLINIHGRSLLTEDIQSITLFNQYSLPIYFALTKGENKQQIKDYKQTLELNLLTNFQNRNLVENKIFCIESFENKGKTELRGLRDFFNEINRMLKSNETVQLLPKKEESLKIKSRFSQLAFSALLYPTRYNALLHFAVKALITGVILSQSNFNMKLKTNWLTIGFSFSIYLIERLLDNKLSSHYATGVFIATNILFSSVMLWRFTKEKEIQKAESKRVNEEVIKQFDEFVESLDAKKKQTEEK